MRDRSIKVFEDASTMLATRCFGSRSRPYITCGAIRQQGDDEDEKLGEVPAEFLDPIMDCVMRDPVILPTSNTTVERSTIVQHLLNDATDPFNRKPLTADMLQPNNDLRIRVHAWIAERTQAE